MRTIILAAAAALAMSVQMAASVKADETTVIRKDGEAGGSTTVIKKHEDTGILPIPHREEKKVIIHRHDDD